MHLFDICTMRVPWLECKYCGSLPSGCGYKHNKRVCALSNLLATESVYK